MKEIWKDIKDYEGMYQVSNLGRVRSLNYHHTKQVKLLSLCVNYKGYLKAHLCKNNKGKKASVHRLVAEAFIPNIENLPQVNHIDGNKLNNCVTNLEWCTQEHNIQHAYKNGLIKHQKGVHFCNDKKVNQYDLNGNFIKQWNYISDASSQLNVSSSSIYRGCNNKIKKPKLFIWRYAND